VILADLEELRSSKIREMDNNKLSLVYIGFRTIRANNVDDFPLSTISKSKGAPEVCY